VPCDVLCDLGDEFYDHAAGGLGLLPARQPLVDNLSPNPMSTRSLLSYYGNNSNFRESVESSSAVDPPAHIHADFQHEQSVVDDPMEVSDSSVNAVRSSCLRIPY
jgi:hypothetical protein